MENKDKEIRAQKRRLWAELSSAGIQFPVSIGIGYFMGKYLDKWFNTYPYLTIIFSIFGVVAAFVNIFRLNSQLTKLEEKERKLKDED
ncbi:ATP synthase protein I [Thermotomaculum hydrothermale]|uniref:ATP synthase protein I n=1 Tax=Thermotomaculum hydrothermale TaxID=981385 RepID=A0A7R6SZG4_9BACT|nr:AtpZ/AtpI family protein [Thermotomaculum hydrothermale]BBB32717.1 ATP synthase protein I [Thermotomaculum hydrothermale]